MHNNELNNNIILAARLSSSSVSTAKLTFNNHIANFLTGVSYFYVVFNPLSTLSDYIGFKTTMGGLTLIKSMIQNSIIKSFIKFMLCLPSNIRPHVVFNNAVKFNQDIELTPLR